MDVYQIDAQGMVRVATRNVEARVRELRQAEEQLAIAKLFAAIKNGQVAAPKEAVATK
jgi:hypothetical protein